MTPSTHSFIQDLSEFAAQIDACSREKWTLHKAKDGYWAKQSVMVKWRKEVVNRQAHIVYSSTYEVPVLWFNFYHRDGHPLRLEEILEISQTNNNTLGSDLLSNISLAEHPYCGVLFYNIHPCNTSKIMDQLLDQGNYIVRWLSIYGTPIGIRVPDELLSEEIKQLHRMKLHTLTEEPSSSNTEEGSTTSLQNGNNSISMASESSTGNDVENTNPDLENDKNESTRTPDIQEDESLISSPDNTYSPTSTGGQSVESDCLKNETNEANEGVVASSPDITESPSSVSGDEISSEVPEQSEEHKTLAQSPSFAQVADEQGSHSPDTLLEHKLQKLTVVGNGSTAH